MALSKLFISPRVPQQYDAGQIARLFRELETQLDLLSTGRQGAYYGALTAAPTTGTYEAGDWIKNSSPSAGGWFGFICVTAGSPGTWKGFGAIEA